MPVPPIGTKVPPLPPVNLEKKKKSSSKAKAAEEAMAHRPAQLPKEGADFVSIVKKGARAVAYLPLNVFNALWGGVRLIATEPGTALANVKEGWGHFKEEMKNYWVGTKLLAADVRTGTRLLRRVLSGHQLSRRERKQLLRTTVDLLRLVPMAVFVLVPFMELLLPVALKLFPNMLPSTFQNKLQAEEKLKRQLQARLKMADFLQHALHDMATEMSQTGGKHEESTATLLELIKAVRAGEEVPTDMLMKVASLFKDSLTLDNASSDQLIGMARYMGLPSFGSDHMLRFQLRNHLRLIKEDDKQIMWEGIDALNREELRAACQERGMRATGLTKTQYKRQLQHWLDLSVNRNVPASLLIMSRVFMITTTSPEQALADSLAGMDEEVLSETVLDNIAGRDDATVRALKLEITHKQNELIAQEAEAAKAAEAEDAAKAADESKGVEVEELSSEDVVMVDPSDELFVEDPAEDMAVTLTLEETERLAKLASKSALDAEKEMLANMNVEREVIEAEAMLAKGRIGAKVEEDPATERLKGVMDEMLNKLELDLAATDEAIGSKLKVLDKNDDGFITANELRSAVADLLGPECTEDDVWAVIRKLDSDGDGVVPVAFIQDAVRVQEARAAAAAAKQDAEAAAEASKKQKERKRSRSKPKAT